MPTISSEPQGVPAGRPQIPCRIQGRKYGKLGVRATSTCLICRPANIWRSATVKSAYPAPGSASTVLIYDFRRGETPEGILQAYPSIGSLAKVYGAITFVLEHPQAIESYLQEQEALWNKFREEHPIPDELLERLRRTKEELSRRSA